MRLVRRGSFRQADRVSTWILADAHGGADPEADADLLELLATLPASVDRLLILGDLFSVWLGAPRLLTDFQKQVCNRLRALRAGGVRIDFVVGNRDYFVSNQVNLAFDNVYQRDTLLTLGKIPTHVTHGDRIDPSDYQYRIWYRITRSAPVAAIARHIPAGIAGRIAKRLERSLAKTNRKYKSGPLPREAIKRFGRRAKAAGAQRALVGHFHDAMTLEDASGIPVTIAPPWLETRAVLSLDTDGGLQALRPLDPRKTP